jgi:hypothetical protein
LSVKTVPIISENFLFKDLKERRKILKHHNFAKNGTHALKRRYSQICEQK